MCRVRITALGSIAAVLTLTYWCYYVTLLSIRAPAQSASVAVATAAATSRGSSRWVPFEAQSCNTNADAAELQRAVLKTDTTGPRPQCDGAGVCVCPHTHFFDGRECLPWAGSAWTAPEDSEQHSFVDTLRARWQAPPGSADLSSGTGISWELLLADESAVADQKLLAGWSAISRHDALTEWHASMFAGKSGIDIGAGLALATLKYAVHGARMTFIDVAPTNLAIIERIARILGVRHRVRTIVLETLGQLRRDLGGEMFDFVTAFGSMHHAPRELIAKEAQVLLGHLRVGGTWLQLAYPLTRWQRLGSQPFSVFGDQTDAGGTPWGEWYEPGKLLETLAPGRFVVNWCGILNNHEYNWFQLTYLGTDDTATVTDVLRQHRQPWLETIQPWHDE